MKVLCLVWIERLVESVDKVGVTPFPCIWLLVEGVLSAVHWPPDDSSTTLVGSNLVGYLLLVQPLSV